MKIKTQIRNLDAKFRNWILADVYKENCRTHWTVSVFKTSISDYDQWPREIKLTAILKTCLNYFLLLNQSEYSRGLTSSWNQSNSYGQNLTLTIWNGIPLDRRWKNSTACTRGFSRRFAVFRRPRREKPLASTVSASMMFHNFCASFS